MNKRINALTIVCLSVLALVVSSCSSKSETPETPADDADVLPYSDGAPSNTGIATMPRASTVPLTEQRPVLIDLDYLTDANGFSTRVSSADEEFGRELYALGDINGDALPDFSFSTDKQTTVVFGSSSKLSDINLDDLDDASGLVLEGAYSFQGVGDLNNDGIDDLGISGSTSELFPSMVRIVFGRSDGELKRALLETVPGVDGVDIYNSAMADQFRSITSAGDFNNDGIDDLLIGGYARFDVNHTAANAWVIYCFHL